MIPTKTPTNNPYEGFKYLKYAHRNNRYDDAIKTHQDTRVLPWDHIKTMKDEISGCDINKHYAYFVNTVVHSELNFTVSILPLLDNCRACIIKPKFAAATSMRIDFATALVFISKYSQSSMYTIIDEITLGRIAVMGRSNISESIYRIHIVRWIVEECMHRRARIIGPACTVRNMVSIGRIVAPGKFVNINKINQMLPNSTYYPKKFPALSVPLFLEFLGIPTKGIAKTKGICTIFDTGSINIMEFPEPTVHHKILRVLRDMFKDEVDPNVPNDSRMRDSYRLSMYRKTHLSDPNDNGVDKDASNIKEQHIISKNRKRKGLKRDNISVDTLGVKINDMDENSTSGPINKRPQKRRKIYRSSNGKKYPNTLIYDDDNEFGPETRSEGGFEDYEKSVLAQNYNKRNIYDVLDLEDY